MPVKASFPTLKVGKEAFTAFGVSTVAEAQWVQVVVSGDSGY